MPENGCEDAPGPAYTGSDTRQTLPAPATHHYPSGGLGGSWGPHGRHSPKSCAQEGAGKNNLAQAAPTVLPHIPAKPVKPPYPQVLLAPCSDPPPPYTAPKCGQASLQERWHRTSTYFSMRILLLFRMEERRRLLTPFCPGTLESTSDSTTDSYVSLCVSREI